MKKMVLLPIDILFKEELVQLFGRGRGSFPVAERIGASTISLPLYPRLKIISWIM